MFNLKVTAFLNLCPIFQVYAPAHIADIAQDWVAKYGHIKDERSGVESYLPSEGRPAIY